MKAIWRVLTMRTLYIRIIVMTMLIMILSGISAFVATNVYYHHYLKPMNDQKITEITEKTISVFEEHDNQEMDMYLSVITDLGYQLYLVDEEENGQMFGASFRKKDISDEVVESVLAGETYHGIANFPQDILITGFFSNDLKNTIGMPLEVSGEQHALFLRPNAVQQFGEMRFFLAILLGFALVFSFLLVLISTIFIVRPVKKLTEATKTIAAGNYYLKLNVKRKDEIGQLAEDFAIMSDSLKRTDEMRQEFVSNVSHEIQSPLTSIQGFSQALREEQIPEETKDKYLSIIEKESRRLSALSKQLLTLSFLDSEMDQKEFVHVDLEKQIKEVVNTTEWQWRKKNMAIELDVAPYIILGDPKLLYQVWMNLLTNAIRYTNEEELILVKMVIRKEGVTVSIKDSGIGIEESEIPMLFDRFYKADKARTRTENSTGLGLSIVKKVIELHGGTITIESKIGEGTEFFVFLPKQK